MVSSRFADALDHSSRGTLAEKIRGLLLAALFRVGQTKVNMKSIITKELVESRNYKELCNPSIHHRGSSFSPNESNQNTPCTTLTM